MSKRELPATRATLRPPAFPEDHREYLGTLWQEPEPPLASEVDIILMPAERFRAMVDMWEMQLGYLRSQQRKVEADRLALCLQQLGSLFLHATLDTTTTTPAKAAS